VRFDRGSDSAYHVCSKGVRHSQRLADILETLF
jgi:hypothetical protein